MLHVAEVLNLSFGSLNIKEEPIFSLFNPMPSIINWVNANEAILPISNASNAPSNTINQVHDTILSISNTSNAPANTINQVNHTLIPIYNNSNAPTNAIN